MALNKTKLLVGALAALIAAFCAFTAVSSAAPGANAQIVIAVVDTGVNPGGIIPQSMLVPGYNAIDDSSNTADKYGHGTNMATLIARRVGSNSDTGASCPACKIMPIKTHDDAGRSNLDLVAEGINWASANGAQVISLSINQDPDTEAYGPLDSAIQNALARGIAVVIAAGNNNRADPAANHLAADADGERAIRVAAVSNDQLTGGSNHGEWVELGTRAPFTSDAAAVTSGVVAMMLSFSPGLTPEQVKDKLHSSCTSVPTLDVAWHCVLNPDGAVRAAGWTPTVTPPPPPPPPPAKMAKLSVRKIGRGSVTSKPVAVRCEAAAVPTCTTSLGWGKSVVLMAKPLKGWKFGHWSGACKGTKPTCTVPPLNKTVTSVTAFFVRAKK